MNKHIVDDKNINLRLDQYLSIVYPKLSRSFIQKLIKEGLVLVNGDTEKQRYLIREGDIIEVLSKEIEEESVILDKTNLSKPLDIVYEDEHILVINKPRGLVIHPAESFREETLVDILKYQNYQLSSFNKDESRPGIIHRIDKDSSGLLIVCKTNEAHEILANDFKENKIKRVYKALCYGNVKEDKFKVIAPIGRNPNNRLKMSVIESGRYAETHFEVEERFNNYTLLKASLQTGRTHQIRVHLLFINHPIVGDTLYSKKVKGLDGQFLHAYMLEFEHPITKKKLQLEAPLSNELNNFISRL